MSHMWISGKRINLYKHANSHLLTILQIVSSTNTYNLNHTHTHTHTHTIVSLQECHKHVQSYPYAQIHINMHLSLSLIMPTSCTCNLCLSYASCITSFMHSNPYLFQLICLFWCCCCCGWPSLNFCRSLLLCTIIFLICTPLIIEATSKPLPSAQYFYH